MLTPTWFVGKSNHDPSWLGENLVCKKNPPLKNIKHNYIILQDFLDTLLLNGTFYAPQDSCRGQARLLYPTIAVI